MKSKTAVFLREVFCSFETPLLLISFLVIHFTDININELTIVWNFINTDNKLLSFSIILSFHVACFLYCANSYKTILLPNEKFNKTLIHLPEYPEMKITAIVSVIEPCISIIIILYLIILKPNMTSSERSLILIATFIYSSIDTASNFFAGNTINELLFKYLGKET